jgi:integrase
MEGQYDAIDQKIEDANQRLKAGQIGVAIERRGGMLWLRATLPPSPDSGKDRPYRQRVALGAKASLAGLSLADRKARLMGAQIADRAFDWAEWGRGTKIETMSLGEWVKQFEADYWLRRKRTQQSEETWKSDYQKVFSRLPLDQPLAMPVLLELVATVEPDSRSRKRFCMVLGKLAEFAKLSNVEAIKDLSGDYSAGKVQPRSLPSDEAISQWRLKIPDPGWQWIYGMVAVYGLRPHEAFHLDLANFPEIQVAERSKTGDRIVYPLYPEWAESWNLINRHLPGLHDIDSYSNVKLGAKAAGYFYDRKLPFPLYNLRHCFARRCFEFGFTAEMGAKLMGHSVAVHCQTYKAWIDQDVYRRLYEALIRRTDRPTPPPATGDTPPK